MNDVQRASKRTGVPEWLIQAVMGQESGGRQNAVSPAGARGRMQLMPGTAARLSKAYGINTNTPFGNLLGGAYYLKEQLARFKTIPLALAAYNAGPGAVAKYNGIPPYHETQNYVKNIMGHKPTGAESPQAFEPVGAPANTPGGAPAAPVFSVDDAANQGLAALASGTYDPTAGLAALQRASDAAMQAAPQDTSLASAPSNSPALPTGPVKWQKWVTLAPGADRPGVSTQPVVLQFVGGLGRMAGRRLTIGTGTDHKEMTVNGNVSDHWDGHAADIPATGNALIRLGRLALIRAGMPRAQAMKQKGGLFNVGGWQVIFNTHEGGDHTNHLHVGKSH